MSRIYKYNDDPAEAFLKYMSMNPHCGEVGAKRLPLDTNRPDDNCPGENDIPDE